MIVLVSTFAALMAAAPTNSVVAPTEVMPPWAAPTASDHTIALPASATEYALAAITLVPAEFLPRAAVSEPSLPAQATTAPSLSIDDVVVVGQRRAPHGDPLQKLNAKAFAATDVVDKAFVGPIAHAYEHAVPKPVRNGLRNFLNNLDEPVAFLNFLLQLKPGKAAETLGRFTVNSTVGVAGIFDVARRHPFHLPLRSIGFADTLGYYGVKSGPFLFLPLVGPTTLRDLMGGAVDGFVLPSAFGRPFNQLSFTLPTTVIRELDSRDEFDEQLNKIRETANPYAARRELYVQQRRAQIDKLRSKRRSTSRSDTRLTNPAIDPLTSPILPVRVVSDQSAL